jgi:hypothetical protein
MIRPFALPVAVLLLLFFAVACGGPDEDLRGWKQSDVEIVSEGAATGTTSRIVAPGQAPGGGTVALTSTDIDTTGLLETVPQDQLPDYADDGNGTFADRFGVAREDGTIPPVRAYPPATTTTRPATAPSQTTTTARPEPSTPSTTRGTTSPATTTTRTAEPVREQSETRERETSRSEESESERSGQRETTRPSEPADPPAERTPPAPEPSSPEPSSDEEPAERQPPPDNGDERREARGE